MTTKFIKHPGAITIAPDFSGIAIDRVPSGYYRVAVSQQMGWHLIPVEPLNTPPKVYGSLLKHVPRIKQVFAERVGVPTTLMLEGLKGSGKSLMMKTIAKEFVEEEDGIVLLCNAPYAGDDFFEFLQSISQKKIVLMDEFDKVYNQKEDRNKILTLLDGLYASHTMFILTMNASSHSSAFEFFHNRPGRVFFNIKFKGVDYDAIQAYLEDCLDNQERLPEVMQFVKRFTEFNMDMLGTLVREINALPGAELEEIATYLNVKPDLSLDDVSFDIKVERNGLDVTKILRISAISDRYIRNFLKTIGTNDVAHLNFMSADLDYINSETGVRWKRGDSEDLRENSNIIVHNKKEIVVDEFDEYLYTDSIERTQNPKTGEIILTGKTTHSVEENEYKVTLLPVMRKQYSYVL